MTTLVDTNVLLDLFLKDESWLQRSLEALQSAFEAGTVAIGPVVYAEVAPTFDTKEGLDAELADLRIAVLPLTRTAAFLAGHAYTEYRRQGGPRTSLLADFFIGAQAAVGRHPILTRDPRRYRTYFPTVEILEP